MQQNAESYQTEIKRARLMNPYVQLRRSFVCSSRPLIANQFNNSEMSDVTVKLADTDVVFYVHRLVLSSASDMFNTWLSDNWQKSESPILSLVETDEELIESFLRFFYTGHLVVTSANIVDYYMLADKYLVSSLLNECSTHIGHGLEIKVVDSTSENSDPKITAEETFTLQTVARIAQFTCPKLSKMARYNLIMRLSSELRAGKYFLTMPLDLPRDVIVDIIGDDSFICSEFILFCCLKQWIQQIKADQQIKEPQSGNSPNALEDDINALISCVRFPLMNSKELYECERAGLELHLPQSFVDYIHAALRYIVFKDCTKACIEETWDSKQYKPRSLNNIINFANGEVTF